MKNNFPEVSLADISRNLFRKNIFFAALSGILLFLSFPKYGSGVLAWVALVPLFYALKNAATIRHGLLLGFITGIISYVGIIYWIAHVIVNYGHLPLHIGIALMLLLAAYLSLYLSFFAGCLVSFREKVPFYIIGPALWVSLEFCKSFILTGFPWENLGYSQYGNTYLIQVADIFGVPSLSFLIVLVNAVLLDVIHRRTKKEYVVAGMVFVLIAGIYVYGFFRLREIDATVTNAPGIDVSLIQGNIDQAVKWDQDYKQETLDIYERLSLKNKPGRGSLIIWPETAVPFKFQNINRFRRQIIDLSLKTQSWLLFGSVSYEPGAYGNDFFNSAYLLSPSGDVRGRYDKVHLVPYGEYVPFRDLMPFVKGLTSGIGDFSSGAGFDPLSLNDKKIGVLICYEGILPFASRAYKNKAAELLVNITNDAWFGATSAPFQHFSMAVFRAVEMRLYLVRAANTGISGIIDPAGRIIAKTGIFQEEALKGHAKFVTIPTVYERVGDIFIIGCFMMVSICFIFSLRRRSQK